MDNISVCGSDCRKCYCFGEMCKGCNACKGRVFHCEEGHECAVYACCVTKNGFNDCSECGEVPCDIWEKTRDPKFTDEEFAKNTAERIARLRSEDKGI